MCLSLAALCPQDAFPGQRLPCPCVLQRQCFSWFSLGCTNTHSCNIQAVPCLRWNSVSCRVLDALGILRRHLSWVCGHPTRGAFSWAQQVRDSSVQLRAVPYRQEEAPACISAQCSAYTPLGRLFLFLTFHTKSCWYVSVSAPEEEKALLSLLRLEIVALERPGFLRSAG